MRHPLITICDLRPLTNDELDRLEATLRHILGTAPDLTDTERATLAASIYAIAREREIRRSTNQFMRSKRGNFGIPR
jgi:hypothetical protein